MAFNAIWYHTNLPEEVVNYIESHLVKHYEEEMSESKLHGNLLHHEKRKSQNAWVPTTDWIAGLLWHYISRANRENFLYDINNIDGESIQYTRYEEGEFYGWHTDAGQATYFKPASTGNRDEQTLVNDFLLSNVETVRKLSFVMQLSDPDEYEGGNLQLMDDSGNSIIAPRARGSIVVFDSRTPHRVLKVRKGARRSLVGWTVGPRWK
jgi:predicted 2-oxoglutarate/Fe(II)-dependent dioxygenase YbiX